MQTGNKRTPEDLIASKEALSLKTSKTRGVHLSAQMIRLSILQEKVVVRYSYLALRMSIAPKMDWLIKKAADLR